jgi:hypothetical protein
MTSLIEIFAYLDFDGSAGLSVSSTMRRRMHWPSGCINHIFCGRSAGVLVEEDGDLSRRGVVLEVSKICLRRLKRPVLQRERVRIARVEFQEFLPACCLALCTSRS